MTSARQAVTGVDAPAAVRRSPLAKLRRFRGALPAALLALAVGAPLVLLVVSSFNVAGPTEEAVYGLDNWRQAFDRLEMWRAIGNTLSLSATKLVIAVGVGVVIAWLIARTDMPGGNAVEFCMWLAFFIPSLPLALGWIALADPLSGPVNLALRELPWWSGRSEGPLNVYSFWGIVWVHLTSMTIPYMVILLVPTFRRMGAVLEEAARMCGAGRFRSALMITVPLMTPAVLGAAMLSFIRGLQAFEVELLLGTPIKLDVFATQIYRWVRFDPPQYGIATALGSLFFLVMLVLALVYRRALRNREFTTVAANAYSTDPVRLGRTGRLVALAGCVTFLVVGVALPVGFMLAGSFMRRYGWYGIDDPFTTEHWAGVLGDPIFVSAAQTTVLIGLGSVVVGGLVYWAVAHLVVKSRIRTAGLIDITAWLPIAIPGMLMGLGLLWVYLATPLRTVLYASVLGLILAIVIGHLPTGVQQMKAALLQVGDEHEQAARMSGANRWTSYRRVVLPLIGPSVAAMALLTFASAIREISAVVLLAGRSTRPLSLLMLEYSFSGDLERAAALGIITTAIMGVAAVIARRLANRSLRRRDPEASARAPADPAAPEPERVPAGRGP